MSNRLAQGEGKESPNIRPDIESEASPVFHLKIVRELRDRASKRHLIQAQTAP